jgi:hypothetical protein
MPGKKRKIAVTTAMNRTLVAMGFALTNGVSLKG